MSQSVHKRPPFSSKKKNEAPESPTFSENQDNGSMGPLCESNMFYWIFGLRLFSIFCVQTYFAPDEYWQSTEVAHNLVYGYGYLTWEWKVGLRSYLHPLVIAFMFQCLKLLQLDYASLLVIVPRLAQAFMSAKAEVYFYKFLKKWFGAEIAIWSTVSLCTSWMWFYCATRTLMNTVETGLACFAIYTYPWNLNKMHLEVTQKLSVFTLIASLSVVLRPTSVSMWAVLFFWLFYRLSNNIVTLRNAILRTIFVAATVLVFSTAVDRLAYGRWVFVHYNFFHFNVVMGQGAIYGKEPWHWYITEGIPVISATHLPFILHGLYLLYKSRLFLNCTSSHTQNAMQVCKLLCVVSLSTVLMYSLVKHKEHRFLINLLPILCFICAVSITTFTKKGKALALTWLIATNSAMSLYFGVYHQSSPIKVVSFLRQRAEINTFNVDHNNFVLFLLPCHSTPYYSHIHHNVSMQFLNCNPDLEGFGKRELLSEQDIFYTNPEKWLKVNVLQAAPLNNECSDTFPLHIVMYDTLYNKIRGLKDLLKCYFLCFTSFHTHFPEGKMGAYMYVLCRKDKDSSQDVEIDVGLFH